MAPLLPLKRNGVQGHALFTRQAGGANPCPATDFTGGFNQFFARAYGLNGTIEETYGTAFNPFLNDQNFFLSVVTLEELGATGRLLVPSILITPTLTSSPAAVCCSHDSCR
jgi:hypothetical protein